MMFKSVSSSGYAKFISRSRDLFDGCVSDIGVVVENLDILVGIGMLSNKLDALISSISNMEHSLGMCLYDRSLGTDFDPEHAVTLLGSVMDRHWNVVMSRFDALSRVVRNDRFILENLDALEECLLNLHRVIQDLIEFLDD